MLAESQNTIVLKFGGSVLLDEFRLQRAVHEIYRWRRDGYRVVAVVSAMSGETESLLKQCDTIAPGASPFAQSALIGLGEIRSAALLGLLLDRAGIPARVLSPAAIGLRCAGDALQANPVELNTTHIYAGLSEDGVVVIPGFIGVDQQGRTVTLGRGGSDSTAVYIAAKINATRCRLIKDVDGLYESDPAKATNGSPARYTAASFDDAFDTDGSIIQHQSLRLAQSEGVAIELGRFNGTAPTVIAEHATTYGHDDEPIEPLNIAVCGLGTVGTGVVQRLAQLPEIARLTGAACRSVEKHQSLAPILGNIGTDTIELANSECDVLIELIGGIEPARRIVETALQNGKHVITANKALIAEHGQTLLELAHSHGVSLRYSASVGGGLPVLEQLNHRDIVSVSGVLNGTSQFVLRSIAAGSSFEHAVDQAQRLGYAEADPSRDLDGRDAFDKLRVIALQLGWSGYESNLPACDPSVIDADSGIVCQIGHISPLVARVRLEQVDAASPYAQLGASDNLIEIECADGHRLSIHGKGAGRDPTSESVLGDVLELSRELCGQRASLQEVAHG